MNFWPQPGAGYEATGYAQHEQFNCTETDYTRDGHRAARSLGSVAEGLVLECGAVVPSSARSPAHDHALDFIEIVDAPIIAPDAKAQAFVERIDITFIRNAPMVH
jgi:hypothetical protein